MDGNLLEASGRGYLYLMVKRGSGPPVVALTANASAAGPTWSSATAKAFVDGQLDSPATITLYYSLSPEAVVQRSLVWTTPCLAHTS